MNVRVLLSLLVLELVQSLRYFDNKDALAEWMHRQSSVTLLLRKHPSPAHAARAKDAAEYAAFLQAAAKADRASTFGTVRCEAVGICEGFEDPDFGTRSLFHGGQQFAVVRAATISGSEPKDFVFDSDAFKGDLKNGEAIADFVFSMYSNDGKSPYKKYQRCADCVKNGGGWSFETKTCAGYKNDKCSGGYDDFFNHNEGFKHEMDKHQDCRSCVAAGYGWCTIQKTCGGFVNKVW